MFCFLDQNPLTLASFFSHQEIHSLQSKSTDVVELQKEREEAMQRLQVSRPTLLQSACSDSDTRTQPSRWSEGGGGWLLLLNHMLMFYFSYWS